MKHKQLCKFFITGLGTILMGLSASFTFSDESPLAEKWIVMEEKRFQTIDQHFAVRKNIPTKIKSIKGLTIGKIRNQNIGELSHSFHETYKRCGGFTVHNSLAEAESAIARAQLASTLTSVAASYTINNQSTVNPMIADVQASNIAATIDHLSSYQNRYYTTSHGKTSAEWIHSNWSNIASSRSDIQVQQFSHSGWPQPSVIATIPGASSEIIVVGAHLDSTVGWSTGENTRAPGADDDASGVAIITEMLRIMVAQEYVPAKTIKLMGYAAEEVGLRGSEEIAEEHKQQGANVIGVLQLDMTNYKGSIEDIVIFTDYTNSAQNQFVADLIAEYQNVTVGYSSCGYGCSDHASWHAQGYPTSMPFEAKMGDHNPKIHTSGDTLANSDPDASNSVPFAVLALSYVGELAKGTLGGTPPPPPPPSEDVVEEFSGSVARRAENQIGSFDGKVNTQVLVEMTGTNDADLYVKIGSQPSTSNWDCRPYRNGSTETCQVTVPASGQDVYVMVRGYSSATSNYTVKVTYTPN